MAVHGDRRLRGGGRLFWIASPSRNTTELRYTSTLYVHPVLDAAERQGRGCGKLGKSRVPAVDEWRALSCLRVDLTQTGKRALIEK